MSLRFLYLDDNDKITRDGDVELINKLSEKRIEIFTDYPCSWSQRSRNLIEKIDSLDGLIIDWELTNNSQDAKKGSEEAEDIDFSAESLAEHLRVMVLNGTRDIPIILCSADKNNSFTKIRSKEITSRQLFDLTFLKKELFVHKAKLAERQLFDLAHVYCELRKEGFDIKKHLSLNTEEIENLDIRFIDDLITIFNTETIHDIVQFLLRDFIEKEGILINEAVLAARLGVDLDKSSNDWKLLCEILNRSSLQYEGVLSHGWTNFWAFKLDKWWNENFENVDLRTTGATERVKLLNDRFGLNLSKAERIKYCSSEEFWTVCQGFNRPLDPLNGFLIGDSSSNPWNNLQYVSGLAELDKSDHNKWKINVMDRENFAHFKFLVLQKQK